MSPFSNIPIVQCGEEMKMKVRIQELQSQRNFDGKPKSAILFGHPLQNIIELLLLEYPF